MNQIRQTITITSITIINILFYLNENSTKPLKINTFARIFHSLLKPLLMPMTFRPTALLFQDSMISDFRHIHMKNTIHYLIL